MRYKPEQVGLGILLLAMGTAQHPWPMFQHDPQHTGRSPYVGPASPVEKWRFEMESAVPIRIGLTSFGLEYPYRSIFRSYPSQEDGGKRIGDPSTPHNPNVGIIAAEFLGATAGAVGMSLLLMGSAYLVIEPGCGCGAAHKCLGCGIYLAFLVIGIGYGVGFPLGSALGTYCVGELFRQEGSFVGSLLGGVTGTAAVLGLGVIILHHLVHLDLDKYPKELLRFGIPLAILSLPPIGSVAGYNLFRRHSSDTKPQGYMYLPRYKVYAHREFPYSAGLKIEMSLMKIEF